MAVSDPGGQFRRVLVTPCGGEKHDASLDKAVASNHLEAPLEILPGGNHELHLVPWPEESEIVPTIAMAFPASGGFDVHDDRDLRRQGRNIERAAGFHKNAVTCVNQGPAKRRRIRLRQRFTPRDLDQVDAELLHATEDLVQGHPLAFGEGVGSVAITATKGAAREADEYAG
jgi:hypothetical protein